MGTERAGIFACDASCVVTSREGILGNDVVIATIPTTEVSGVSKDGTAPDAGIFLQAWDAIKRNGQYLQHEWTVKVDPDTVFLPERLRPQLLPGKRPNNPYPPPYSSPPTAGIFVTNCDKMASWGKGWGDGWPMMYGAIEILSR